MRPSGTSHNRREALGALSAPFPSSRHCPRNGTITLAAVQVKPDPLRINSIRSSDEGAVKGQPDGRPTLLAPAIVDVSHEPVPLTHNQAVLMAFSGQSWMHTPQFKHCSSSSAIPSADSERARQIPGLRQRRQSEHFSAFTEVSPCGERVCSVGTTYWRAAPTNSAGEA